MGTDCRVTGCERKSRSRGLCHGHYAHLRRHGSLRGAGVLNIMEWHGLSRTPEHIAWAAMRSRCLNKSHPSYKNYGARGISICKRWDSFRLFLKDMGRRPKGLSLERMDNESGYSPNNCCWATVAQQNKNRRKPASGPGR